MIIEAAAATTKGAPRPAEIAMSLREFLAFRLDTEEYGIDVLRLQEAPAAGRQPGAGGRVFKLSHDAQGSQAAALHHGAERRGPHRATNVTRPKFGAKSAAPRRGASPASSAPATPPPRPVPTTGKPSRSSG